MIYRQMTAVTQPSHSSISSHVRPIESGRDLLAVADLVEICFSDTLDKDGRRYIRQMRAAARNPFAFGLVNRVSPSLSGFVWEENGKVVGNLSLMPVVALGKPSFLIANVAVHPEYRQRGIAKVLTEESMAYILKRGVNSVWLQANDKNPIAVHLYRGFGFSEIARRTSWHSTS